MTRLVLIFVIAFLMVMQAGAGNTEPRGQGRGWGGDRHSSGQHHGGNRYYGQSRPGWRYRQGYGWYDPSAAIIGGAIGGWLWRQFNQPDEVVVQEPVRGMEWCMNRYKSYDPYTKTYLGYDGLRHGCP